MKEVIKVTLISILVIILISIIVLSTLGVILYTIDKDRIENGQEPKYCVASDGIYMDGGSREYYGLGYKVIKFNKINGYNETKIGSWFMDIDDFDDEIEEYEKAPIYMYSAKDPEDKKELNEINKSNIRDIIGNLEYNNKATDDATVTYIIEDTNGIVYRFKPEIKSLSKNDKETVLDDANFEFLKQVINDTMGISDSQYEKSDEGE